MTTRKLLIQVYSDMHLEIWNKIPLIPIKSDYLILAGIGYTYNEDDDVFVAPEPYPSWSLDENHDWQAPTPRPDGEGIYAWDETDLAWVEVVL